MRPPGAKRGAAPFGSAESHELRSWARLRRAGCAPAPAFPQCFPHPLLSLPLSLHSLKPPLLPSPFLPLPRRPNPPKITKHPAFAHPAAPAARAPNGAQPLSAPPKATSFARGPALRAGGLRPCPLQLPPNASSPKNSPAAFHRLRGSVHLWYFVPALIEQARYSCSHSSTRAS